MRGPTERTTQVDTIGASSGANTAPTATISPARPEASAPPAIPLAIASPAVPSAETPPAIRAPEPSTEPQAAVASASFPVTDPRFAVASERVESPTQPPLVPSIAAPPAPEPQPTAETAHVSPQLKPVIAADNIVPATQPTGTRIPAEEIARLLARGDALFRNGDIASARLFYERAAEGGDAQAALWLGGTYDPAFLAWARLNGVSGDPAAAVRWYRYARELGAAKGEILLTGVATHDEAAKRPKEMNQLFEQFLTLSRQKR